MGVRRHLCLFGLAIFVAEAPATAHAECKRTAVPVGDPALVSGMRSRLAANGIETTTTAGCPAMQVRLEQRGQQVHLQISDAYQRLGERDVRDLATAAAVIESWSLQEIEEGALPALTSGVSIVPMVAAHLVRSGIGASVQSSLGTNGTTWVGGAVSACVRVGALCVGATARLIADTTATGDTTTIAQDTTSIDALATADLPRKLGSFIVSPGIAVGYGHMSVTTHHHDGMGMLLDIGSLDHQLRAGVHVSLLRALGPHLSVFGDLSTDAALVRSDSSAGPSGAIRFGIGVRVEAP